MAVKIHIADIGTVIEIQFLDRGQPVDLTTATEKEIIFRTPKGILKTQSGTFVGTEAGDGTDGRIRWTSTLSTDWDIDGEWGIQGRVAFSGGTEFRSEKKTFQVECNYI